MKVSRHNLEQAAERGLIEKQQIDPLYRFLHAQQNPDSRFNLTNTLYYLGGFLAIGALSLFMNLGWEQFGGWGIVGLCMLYGLAALLLLERLHQRQPGLPAALTAVFILALVPLAIYGFQLAMDWWDAELKYREYHRHIRPLWLWMEFGTLLVAVLLLSRYRYPLLMLPLALTLWYLSMDLADLITGNDASWRERSWMTMWFGLVILFAALAVDMRPIHHQETRSSTPVQDYAWWLYLAGVLAFWGGMTAQDSDNELAKLGYCTVNLLLIGSGIVLQRRVLALFGAMGVSLYLGHLTWSVFEDSWLFPVVLIALGILIVYLGLIWQRHERRLSQKMQAWLPDTVLRRVEQRRY
ncbi:MAG: DUF2157 domain-containing protein [Marinobacterium sp.]|nr:DUF2157 domain-containing protein [Marinobacterium sp.]